MAGPLAGLRVVELAGLGPGPFCAMLLADMGAEVVRVQRLGTSQQLAATDVLVRGREVVELDLKLESDRQTLKQLCACADVLIEGFRPGVMERLALGPAELLSDNPALIYARMTGWGQTGEMAPRAGHDINYIAISGVLHAIGDSNHGPAIPLNLIGDFGGGGMMLAMGILAGVLNARQSGQGQVIDAAMSDGSALLSSMMWGFMQSGHWVNDRGANFLDGAAHFYTTYACADGKYVAVGAIEPQFYQALCEGLDLAADDVAPNYRSAAVWSEQKAKLAEVFRRKSRDEWCELFKHRDACVAPVLDWHEAKDYVHNQQRRTFIELDGVTQPAPAPRFSVTPSEAKPFQIAADGVKSILTRWQVSSDEH